MIEYILISLGYFLAGHVIIGLAVVLMVLLWEIFIATWYVIKFYSHGPIGKISLPFILWWYFFRHAPRYIVRLDKGIKVYRPFAIRLPEVDPDYDEE